MPRRTLPGPQWRGLLRGCDKYEEVWGRIMADLEIPEGELLALAGAAAGMPGGEAGAAASGCGQAVDLRASQHAGRVTSHAGDIGDLDGEFTSLDAYYEQQFNRPTGNGQQPI